METELPVLPSSFLTFSPISEYLLSLIHHVSHNLKLETSKLLHIQCSTKANVLPIQWFQLLPMRLTRSLIHSLSLHSNLNFNSPNEYLQAMQVLWDQFPNYTHYKEVQQRSCLVVQLVTCSLGFHLMKSTIWGDVPQEEQRHWEQRWSHVAYRICTWTLLVFQHYQLQLQLQLQQRTSNTFNDEVIIDKLDDLELQAFFIFGVIMLQTYILDCKRFALIDFLKLISFLRDRSKHSSSSFSSSHAQFYLPLWTYVVFVLKKVFKLITFKENQEKEEQSVKVNEMSLFQALVDIMRSNTCSFGLLSDPPLIFYILQTCLSCCYSSPPKLNCIVQHSPYFTFHFISMCQHLLSLVSSSSSSSSSSSDSFNSPNLLLLSVHRVLFEFHLLLNQTYVLQEFSTWLDVALEQNVTKTTVSNEWNLANVVNEMKARLKTRFFHSTITENSNFILSGAHPFLF